MVMMRPPLPRWASAALLGDNLRAHVDIEERVDVRERDVLEFAQSKNPRIVDEDVEAAKLGDRLRDRSLNGGDVGAVGLDRHGFAPLRLYASDDFRRTLRRLLVSDATSAPSAASAFAIAAPMARLAPVTYEEIAAEEGVSASRIRQIVSQELEQRGVDSGASMRSCNWIAWLRRFSSLQRASPPAIFPRSRPYLKALDRLDRYQVVASANQAMTTKRARSSWTRSIVSPRTSASTRTSKPRCRRT